MESVAQETSDTKSVKVTRVVDHPLPTVWDTLIGPAGAGALLGEGGEFGNKGEDWRSNDGTYGVTRSFHPREQIRFSWHASEGAAATMVDVQVKPEGDGRTAVSLSHEHLPREVDEEQLTRRWEAALDRIASATP
ncbi:SRPBCC domain-containing protein [Tessaracoccus sp. OS52]|uniref:SRPBCC family protein n=1 Tax=Tessaracoccus sp. OS52 TaxID=2886691 RepID=UPI001D10BAA1|nr:SRPBCC domain-containing protein [Tessaracoccus sp. OS52]MCC2594207.1 SRPBCC domain-containing protein [Tessaracoccus sp. OS52]